MWCKRLERDAFGVATVVATSREFHWVTVNRDHTPEIPKRLNVSAYPSLLVLGPGEQNVHRFQSYMQAPELVAQLDEGLARWRLFTSGEKWDVPNPRPERLSDEVEVRDEAAPSDGVPAGIVARGDGDGELWIAQMGVLQRVGGPAHELPGSVMDLATDGKWLYGVESGWSAGNPIHLIDPATGGVVREIVTEANKTNRSHGAKGVCFHAGRLLVLEGMTGTIHEVDPQSGEIRSTTETGEKWISGLASDGPHLYTGSRSHLIVLDGTTLRAVRKVAVNYPLRAVGVHEDDVLLMEQPVFGFDRAHERIQVWPRAGETRIYRIARTDLGL